MSKHERQYIDPDDFNPVNEAYLSEQYKFGERFLDNPEEANKLNFPQTDIVINSQNCANLPVDNFTFKDLTLLQRILQITNQYIINLPEVLTQIIQEICGKFENVQFAVVLLYNQQNQSLESVAKIGIDVDKLVLPKPAKFLEADTKTSSSSYLNLLDKVLTTGEAKLFQKSLDSVLAGYTPSWMYAVPVNSSQLGCLGVLTIGNWDNHDAFDAKLPEILAIVTDLMAIAIHHATIRHKLEQQEETLATQTAIVLEQQREIERNHNQLQQQKSQLIKAANHKSEFLATTSHELRTPLNVILGLSQVLLRQRNSTLTEQQTDMIERIVSNGNYLLDLIEDMLDFAKVEAGNLSINPEEFNLLNLVLTTVTEYSFLAIEKNLNLRTDINLNYPLVVNDSTFVQQILDKLLSNAIKFTEVGEIVVKLWEISSDRIAIAVQDSGIGIAESHIDEIFEPLRQVDQSITRKYEGAGLGLAITKSFLELMQGTISLTSKLGEGSTFYIEIPRSVSSSVIGDR